MDRLFCTACAAILILLLPAGPLAAEDNSPTVKITEWQVPWPGTRPRDPWYGPHDVVWFVGQAGDYVATLDPASGAFKRYDLEDGTGPHTVIADESGAWYAGNRNQHIGHIEPKTGQREIIELPGDGVRDPHTMAYTSEGNIWFSMQHGNRVGYLERKTRQITLYEIASPHSRPYGLVVDQHDRPWFVLFGTNALATIDPATGKVSEIRLPRGESRPRRLAITADGMVWYVDFAYGYLGRYNPVTRSIDEWPTPEGRGSRPYAMAADANGRVWFVETGPIPNRFVGFDPATATFTTPVTIGSGGRVVRNMVFHEGTGSFWFGTDTDTIGRATVR